MGDVFSPLVPALPLTPPRLRTPLRLFFLTLFPPLPTPLPSAPTVSLCYAPSSPLTSRARSFGTRSVSLPGTICLLSVPPCRCCFSVVHIFPFSGSPSYSVGCPIRFKIEVFFFDFLCFLAWLCEDSEGYSFSFDMFKNPELKCIVPFSY